jgi:site-specific DNA-cytosine methylase
MTGIDTMGVVLTQMLASGAVYKWSAEGCPIARRAHRAFWKSLGQEPTEWTLAEDDDLADPQHRVDVELVTLRCAPFSPKNRKFPTGCEAALRELCAVIKGVRKRSPCVIIYENTAGLWRKASLRRRVEMVLRKCRGYRWEAIKVSPHIHAGVPVRRMRVFYVGIKGASAHMCRAVSSAHTASVCVRAQVECAVTVSVARALPETDDRYR